MSSVGVFDSTFSLEPFFAEVLVHADVEARVGLAVGQPELERARFVERAFKRAAADSGPKLRGTEEFKAFGEVVEGGHGSTVEFCLFGIEQELNGVLGELFALLIVVEPQVAPRGVVLEDGEGVVFVLAVAGVVERE